MIPREIESKLSPEQKVAFMEAYSSAEIEGKDEGDCLSSGWIAAIHARGRIVNKAFVLAAGKFNPQSGSGLISDNNVTDSIYAINRRAEIAVPIPLKYNHRKKEKAIPVGIMQNGIGEDGEAFADLYILQDAIADLDGKGSKVLATIDQMADSLLTGSMKLSIEGWRNVKAPAYFGDRVMSLSPTAWAVLPTGEMPAIPRQKLAAGQDEGELVCFSLDSLLKAQEGEGSMPFSKEANEKIEELEGALTIKGEEATTKDAELLASQNLLTAANEKIADLEKEKEDSALEATELEATQLQEKVAKKLTAGKREELEKDMGKIDSPSERVAILANLDKVLPDLKPKDETLEGGDDASGDTSLEASIKAAKERSKTEKISFNQAYSDIMKERKDNA